MNAFAMWDSLFETLAATDWSQQPELVKTPFGDHRCRYDEDDDGEFVSITFEIPRAGCFVEINDSDWGYLSGLRYYTRLFGD